MVDQPTLRFLAAAGDALAPLSAVLLSDCTSQAGTPTSAHSEAATATAPRTERTFIKAPRFPRKKPGPCTARGTANQWGEKGALALPARRNDTVPGGGRLLAR